MNIVIANSVGVDTNGYHMVHVPSRWSLGVKNHTNCSYYPWELAYTSSLLKRETNHKVKFLDGVLNAWDYDTYIQRLAGRKTELVDNGKFDSYYSERTYALQKQLKKN